MHALIGQYVFLCVCLRQPVRWPSIGQSLHQFYYVMKCQQFLYLMNKQRAHVYLILILQVHL